VIWLFLAGFLVASLGTAQMLVIVKRNAIAAAALEFVVVFLLVWGISEVVIDKTNAVPYASGAALGTWAATRRWRKT